MGGGARLHSVGITWEVPKSAGCPSVSPGRGARCAGGCRRDARSLRDPPGSRGLRKGMWGRPEGPAEVTSSSFQASNPGLSSRPTPGHPGTQDAHGALLPALHQPFYWDSEAGGPEGTGMPAWAEVPEPSALAACPVLSSARGQRATSEARLCPPPTPVPAPSITRPSDRPSCRPIECPHLLAPPPQPALRPAPPTGPGSLLQPHLSGVEAGAGTSRLEKWRWEARGSPGPRPAHWVPLLKL